MLLLAITYMYDWMMFACVFCIQPSFWAFLFIFQLVVCMLIMSLICLKSFKDPSGQSLNFETRHTLIFFISNQYTSSTSLVPSTVEHQGYLHSRGISTLFWLMPMDPSLSPLLLHRFCALLLHQITCNSPEVPYYWTPLCCVIFLLGIWKSPFISSWLMSSTWAALADNPHPPPCRVRRSLFHIPWTSVMTYCIT